MICFFCKAVKTRSKTPCFARRLFVYRVPVAVFFRQAPPFAPVFAPLQNRVQKQQVFMFDVTALNRQ
jgi:hypothetical protein